MLCKHKDESKVFLNTFSYRLLVHMILLCDFHVGQVFFGHFLSKQVILENWHFYWCDLLIWVSIFMVFDGRAISLGTWRIEKVTYSLFVPFLQKKRYWIRLEGTKRKVLSPATCFSPYKKNFVL